MSHKSSELTHFFLDMFTCFTDPDEVVSDEEFEQMKQELSQQREKDKTASTRWQRCRIELESAERRQGLL